MPKWSATDLPDLSGRTFVVTGATSGIGAVAARELSRAGARTVLAVRDVARGEELARRWGGRAEVRKLDLTDLASVRAFADGFSDPVDVLINNAGVMAVPFGRTKDGFETQIGTNHLGHFALTGLLLDRITERVVSVASGAHRIKGFDPDDLNWETRKYDRWKAYGQSKLANLLFTSELQRRFAAAGDARRAVAAHPGWSATHLQGRSGNPLQDVVMKLGNVLIAQSDEAGALPTLYAATQDIAGDTYIGPDGPGEMRGRPAIVDRSKAAKDPKWARALWERSEELTGVRFALGAPAAV